MAWAYKVFQALCSAGFEYRDHSALKTPENLPREGTHRAGLKTQVGIKQPLMEWGKQINSLGESGCRSWEWESLQG